tara:strand:+ start:222 stop:416 length:195 start_codon:yes stop_codon:yes gene_type:complete
MTVYTFTCTIMVCMYLAYLWGRKLTRVEIAAEAARNTLNRLEKEGFIKYEVNKKTGEKEFVRFP